MRRFITSMDENEELVLLSDKEFERLKELLDETSDSSRLANRREGLYDRRIFVGGRRGAPTDRRRAQKA